MKKTKQSAKDNYLIGMIAEFAAKQNDPDMVAVAMTPDSLLTLACQLSELVTMCFKSAALVKQLIEADRLDEAKHLLDTMADTGSNRFAECVAEAITFMDAEGVAAVNQDEPREAGQLHFVAPGYGTC